VSTRDAASSDKSEFPAPPLPSGRLIPPLLIVVSVGAITIAAGTILYRSQRTAPVTISNQGDSEIAGALEHSRGAAKPRVTIEEYGDFQCPPCGMLAGPLKQIEEENKTTLRIVFRHFPFPIHQHAFEASCAAEAADLQGKFWDMHDLLYREQANWSKAANARQLFTSYAGVLGLDIDRFTRDIDSPEVKQRVQRDQQRGNSLGVKNTPTLFLNKESVPPASLNAESLRKLIKEAVEKSGPSPSH
jgi:protein-disulfide isomerase